MPEKNLLTDVRRLFDAVGTPNFGYRELGQLERREAAAAKWPLLGATNRDLGRVARPAPGASELGEGSSAGRRIVALVSLCGGTGRTTVAANLAQTLAAGGHRVLAVDLDPQNVLALHFGLDPLERVGMGRAGLSVHEATAYIGKQRSGAAVLPFGFLADADLAETESRLAADPAWLRLRIEAFAPSDCEYLILDVPAGRNAWSRQALSLADEVLVVLTPNPTSYASVPATESVLADVEAESVYLVNGFDGRSALDRDLVASLRAALPDRVLPFAIQRDEVVREALLHRASVLQEAVDSQVAADFAQLGEWLRARSGAGAIHPLRGARVAG
ncbi:cellulose biosynthesis protein BcsQ [Vulgatibacter sp.]|uniref:cellulose biosynthesis protein BcsQ n=1 Tax=Vulgatibacter sp. TaxID=1971226 RepID=UPI0035687F6D